MKPKQTNEKIIGSKYSWIDLLRFSAWLVVGLFIAQGLVEIISLIFSALGFSLQGLNQVAVNAFISSIIYSLAILFVIFVPKKVKAAKRFSAKLPELGISGLPMWRDILLMIAGIIVYYIFSAILIYVLSLIFPSFDVNQAQDIGISQLNGKCEYLAAFFAIVVLAPLAEEFLFRGYLFGKLKNSIPVWLAILVVSVLFGALHGTWNVAIDTFVLSVVLCTLRYITGSIWAPTLLHMAKNGIAFYFLFINPLILSTL